jgi:hypothetical protein
MLTAGGIAVRHSASCSCPCLRGQTWQWVAAVVGVTGPVALQHESRGCRSWQGYEAVALSPFHRCRLWKG